MDFQSVIMTLDKFWAEHGCLIWHPYNVQVGAGTMNPATVLRVLGPEPWNVAYLEPSVRPADGRYGENPNRWQQYYQYQVILKPDPGNPQELYLQSLQALGIDTSKQDVRFVEDNWESPALGAWGLGWEVWLNGQEISQYTYFQQAGGMEMDPVSVEITYGLERIVMALQGVRTFPEIAFSGDVTYGDIHFQNEVESCIYNFEVADVDNLHSMYDLCEAEAKNALARSLIQPAHDYVLKCSHIFNVLDARGAVGVTERARYFVRMRNLARDVAAFYAQQREELGYPLKGKFAITKPDLGPLPTPTQPQGKDKLDLLLEIGSEELPVGDLDQALHQLDAAVPQMLQDARLAYESISIQGTPRRLAMQVSGLKARQEDQRIESRGPSAQIAFDDDGNPTRAALGFARGKGVEVADLERRDIDGREYVLAVTLEQGREACQVLAEALPELLDGLSFAKSMRWNQSQVSYSRPLRWYVALLDDHVIPFEYAGVRSGRTSRGIRPQDSPELMVASATDYAATLRDAGIMLDADARQASLLEQARALAAEVGGVIQEDPRLVREVANLVEYPLAIRGQFEQEYLRLPDAVLLAVMHKHQRYLPVLKDGQLLPYYVTIANGATLDVDAVRHGNDQVLRARYADAAFFYDSDIKQPLEAFTQRLETLTFEEHLGSVLDKVARLRVVVPELAALLGLDEEQTADAARAAALAKSDLATQMVVELTSLQGIMGRHYALKGGESEAVAQAIEEHYLPRSVGDRLPEGLAGVAVGLADRLDTLVGLYAVGIRPRGTADPWGLRRTALSMLLLLVEKNISLALPEALSTAAEALPVDVDEDVLREVLEFIAVRYRGLLLERGFRYDLVDAVLNERGYDPALAYASVQALTPWTERDDWQELLDSYARCVRITRDREVAQAVDPTKFVTAEAQALYAAYVEIKPGVAQGQSVDALMQAIVALKPAITRFFDAVLVMDKDDDLRNNRIALLQAISALAQGIVDLSVVEGF